MKQLYKLIQVRKWQVEFDYTAAIKLDGKAVIRRSFLIEVEHVGIRGPTLTITNNDIGKVFVVDEHDDDKQLIDVILDPKMHLKQWRKYSGHCEECGSAQVRTHIGRFEHHEVNCSHFSKEVSS